MRQAAEAYARLLEALTADSLDDLRAVATPDVHFRDPFNDVHGVDRMIAAFGHAFTAADDVRFTVHDTALSGTTAYLRWTFACRPRALKAPLEIAGMSEVRFDAHGRVTAHLDYWDAGQGFYEKTPCSGACCGACAGASPSEAATPPPAGSRATASCRPRQRTGPCGGMQG